MQTQTKSRKVTVRKNRKPDTKNRPFNALAVARRMGKRGRGEVIIVHPEGSGFGFKIIWGVYDYEGKESSDIGNTKQSVVASNFKIYKTKKGCVGALKKVAAVFNYSSTFGSGIPVYDHNGKELDLKVKTEFTRIWE